jgi:hypothetical protein
VVDGGFAAEAFRELMCLDHVRLLSAVASLAAHGG